MSEVTQKENSVGDNTPAENSQKTIPPLQSKDSVNSLIKEENPKTTFKKDNFNIKVKIRPLPSSIMANKNSMHSGTKQILTPLKINGVWNFNYSANEFLEAFPNLSDKVVQQRHVKNDNYVYTFVDDEVRKLRLVIPDTGIDLDMRNELHRLYASKGMLESYPQISTTSEKTNYYQKFYFYNEVEEMKKTTARARLLKKCFDVLDVMSLSDMVRTLIIYNFQATELDRDIAESKLITFIEENPQKFLENSEKTEYNEAIVYIRLGIQKRVIEYNNNVYTYNSNLLGSSEMEIVSALSDPSKHQLRSVLFTQIKSVTGL